MEMISQLLNANIDVKFPKREIIVNKSIKSCRNEFILLSNQNAKTVLGILQGLSASATALVKMDHSEASNNSYPLSFLTMPDVEAQLQRSFCRCLRRR